MTTNLKLMPFETNDGLFGHFYEDDSVFLFFGNKNFTQDHFSLFPSLKFQTLKQIHGNKAVYIDKWTDALIEADAQYTQQKKLALAVQTADCLPILAFDQSKKWILAVHAGWRGVENKALKQAIEKVGRSSNASAFSFFVGPHIQKQSFEVDKDVAEKLQNCTERPNTYFVYHIVRDKYFSSLKEILNDQIKELPVKTVQTYFSDVDTFTDENYSSFRRLKNPCRNWSFIYLK